ncbi:MAG: GTP-binding protein [Euryarchaeota archaeon]|nr:GTP-binding protein [Euryarchaeota archaeon]
MEKRRFIRKICLLGEGGVGKTSLVRRYVHDFFSDEYLVSFGTKVTKKVLDLEDTELTLMIWDIVGQKAHKSLHHAYYKGANGAFVVCDVTREETVRSLLEWKDDFLATAGNVPVIALANKKDLEPKVPGEVLAKISSSFGGDFVMTSAKTGEGVQDAFLRLSRLMMEERR